MKFPNETIEVRGNTTADMETAVKRLQKKMLLTLKEVKERGRGFRKPSIIRHQHNQAIRHLRNRKRRDPQ